MRPPRIDWPWAFFLATCVLVTWLSMIGLFAVVQYLQGLY